MLHSTSINKKSDEANETKLCTDKSNYALIQVYWRKVFRGKQSKYIYTDILHISGLS